MNDKKADVASETPELTADKFLNQDFAGVKKYKLTKPVKVADKTISELTLDFESLTSADMEAVASLPGCNSGDANVNEFSKTYLMHIVARAAKITIQEVRSFPIADGTALTLMAQGFLMKAASQITEQ